MSKKTLNTSNLEALGAERLAALLMEVSSGSADIKRRLRLELSHNLGVADLAHEVNKRLISLRKSRSYISWRKRKAFLKDLGTQLAMIAQKIAPQDANAAFDLLWQFIDMAPSIHERVNDNRGEVGEVFASALEHLSPIAAQAQLDVEALAQKVWLAVRANTYGEWDGIITQMAPTLGADGLAALKAHVLAYEQAKEQGTQEDHEALQFLRALRGADQAVQSRHARFIRSCLQEIAAAAGDTAGYIAQYSESELARKDIAAEVAALLLEEGEAERALRLLHDAEAGESQLGQEEWDAAYIASLLALGRRQEAQAHRWACFAERLDAQHLRDYLKLLPDFEDFEAEERAKELVKAYPSLSQALAFFLNWPDLLSAAQLIEARSGELEGDHYGLLGPAAEALRDRHPLAATLLWRAMVDYTLEYALSSRYGHAVEHLADCAALADDIEDFGDIPRHDAYVNALQYRHTRKSAFWAKVHG